MGEPRQNKHDLECEKGKEIFPHVEREMRKIVESFVILSIDVNMQ